MRYGVCTWVFGGEPLPRTAGRLAALGYDGVELAGDLERYRAREVSAVLDDHGLALLSITPENVDLAHPDGPVRSEALDYYLRLLDFAAEAGRAIVCCHGRVGRVRAVASQEEERRLLLDGVRRLGVEAGARGLRVAMEVLNRYESHLLLTAGEALRFVEEAGSSHVGILLDAYHMNIEEEDPAGAVRSLGGRLFLFHAADSNRRAVGRGHTDFPGLFRALGESGYGGDVIVECTASGPDPFTPIKGEGWTEEVEGYVGESILALRRLEAQGATTRRKDNA